MIIMRFGPICLYGLSFFLCRKNPCRHMQRNHIPPHIEGKYILPEGGTVFAFLNYGMNFVPRQQYMVSLDRMGIFMSDFEKIYDLENLYQAHKKARLGKQNTQEVIRYELHLTENLVKLAYHLEHKTYAIRGYHKFMIYDPKEREIQALSYGDRVLQHSLCDNVLGPYLDQRLIYDNAACRVGKGTHFAMDRLTGFMRDFYRQHGTEGYILKCDIRKYFNSVHHDVLKDMIRRMKLSDDIKWLLCLIVDSYECSGNRGIPMGNQTSQWFALYYLDGLDRLVKEKLRIRYYSRYMDDMILLHPCKEYLEYCLAVMNTYVRNTLRLEFNEKTQIHPVSQGVDYLGFHFYLTDTGKVIRRLRQSGKKRIRKRLRALKRLYQNNEIDLDSIKRSVVSTKGHLSHGHTWHLQKNIWKNFVLYKK